MQRDIDEAKKSVAKGEGNTVGMSVEEHVGNNARGQIEGDLTINKISMDDFLTPIFGNRLNLGPVPIAIGDEPLKMNEALKLPDYHSSPSMPGLQYKLEKITAPDAHKYYPYFVTIGIVMLLMIIGLAL